MGINNKLQINAARFTSVSWLPSLAETSAMLFLRAWCWVSAALVALPATPTIDCNIISSNNNFSAQCFCYSILECNLTYHIICKILNIKVSYQYVIKLVISNWLFKICSSLLWAENRDKLQSVINQAPPHGGAFVSSLIRYLIVMQSCRQYIIPVCIV